MNGILQAQYLFTQWLGVVPYVKKYLTYVRHKPSMG